MEYQEFMDIEEFEERLNNEIDELPQAIFNKLNYGVVVYEDAKIHEESVYPNELYIMGEYIVGNHGRCIALYYGSFKKMFSGYSEEETQEKIREVLRHEFTHHLENLAGEKDLEIEDALNLNKFRAKIHKHGED